MNFCRDFANIFRRCKTFFVFYRDLQNYFSLHTFPETSETLAASPRATIDTAIRFSPPHSALGDSLVLVRYGQAGRHRARQLLDQCWYTRFPGFLFSGSAIFPKRFYWRALRGAPFWVAPNSRGSLVLKKREKEEKKRKKIIQCSAFFD